MAAPAGFCLECSTHLEEWEGQAGARTYWFAAREVGTALAAVAGGASYRAASEQARRQADRVRLARVRRKNERRREAVRDGQLAANWVDVFADTITGELLPSSWPQVVVIDSMSMRVLSGERRGQAFHVIAAVGRNRAVGGRWPERLMICRLAASPTKTAAAFEAFCRTVDGGPEVVVTDMDHGVRRGVARGFADPHGVVPEMRMGEWHLGRALRNRLPDALLSDHHNPVTIRLHTAFTSAVEWDGFIAGVHAEHRGVHGSLQSALDFIDSYGAQIRDQAQRRDPSVPNSSSPVEAALRELKARLHDRAGGFTNLARMNRLLGLMALDLRGQCDGRYWADLLRHKTYLAGGHAPHQRQADDTRGTSSLTA